MKKCPSCNQNYSDDNVFCMNDGTTLLFADNTDANPFVIPTGDNQTTQVVSKPQFSAQIPVQSAPKDTSKWLFLVIGILLSAVVAMGAFLLTRSGEKETANQKAKIENTPTENTNRAENDLVKTTLKTNPTVEQPKINPNLNPAGNWSGSLSYPSGASFSGQADLTDEGGGRVSGQIVWTYVSAGNRSKADKIGLSATEYVRGIYDAATRTLTLNGYSESDPHDMIILDKYRLTLAENNRQMSGYSFGGKTRGNFSLRK